MTFSSFFEGFIYLISETFVGMFGQDIYPGLLNSFSPLIYCFCFSGFLLFAFTILYYIFGFLRGG